jgi:SulP family sulfate permease
MDEPTREDPSARAAGPRFADLFTPKLLTVLREGYGLAHLRADAVAGLTVAIVALPLSMAIAIASGVSPAQGLYAAIAGGFLVSLLGGSRFQIGGPAGAFIVLVAATLEQHGADGLILATLMSGAILIVTGYLRLGTYIKFIPYPVTIGFTAGIAVIILASQLRSMLGLELGGPEPSEFGPKLVALAQALPTASPHAIALAAGTIAVIAGFKAWKPHWPGMLIAIGLASAAAGLMDMPVATIGSAFGGIPHGLPIPSLPALSLGKAIEVLPSAFAFALLGSIESLLSAVVADGMTGRRHRSNCELVAQGVANIGSALFGGLCVTGAIARTATNIRAGARSPVSGMMHSAFLLAFMLIAAPLARFIPLSALGGILAVVAWNMAERHQFLNLLRASKGDALVLMSTFLLTVFYDLTAGIVVGFALGAILFINRMSGLTGIDRAGGLVQRDMADSAEREDYDAALATDPDIVVYRIRGVFFFGAASTVDQVLTSIADRHKAFVIDFSGVPAIDSTAANTIAAFARKAAARHAIEIRLTGTNASVRKALEAQGVIPPLVGYAASIEDAVSSVRNSDMKETAAS